MKIVGYFCKIISLERTPRLSSNIHLIKLIYLQKWQYWMNWNEHIFIEMKPSMNVGNKQRKKCKKTKIYRTQRFSIQLKDQVIKIFSKLIYKLNQQEQSFLLDLAKQSQVKQLTINTYLSIGKYFKNFTNNKWPLEEISISSRFLSLGGFKLFCTFQWPNLQKITLCSPMIDARYCRELTLANWPRLKQFTIFHYPQKNSHTIGNDGLEILLTCEWRQLAKLHLDTVGLYKCDLGNLSNAKWRRLQILILENNNLSRRGIQEIVRSNFTQLSELNLQNCNLDDVCLAELSKGKWIFLTFLLVTNNKLSNKGLRELAQGAWDKLRLLKLNYDADNLEAVKIIAKSRCKKITFPCQQTSTLCIRFKSSELTL